MSQPVTDPVSDDDLLARAGAGDGAAFTVLFRRRQGEVFRFALHLTGAPAIAEDVTQDVFLAVMGQASRYQPGRSSVAAWLCGIARNHARRRLSERSLVAFESADEADELEMAVCPDPLGDLTRAEQIEALRRAVLSLPLKYREVVVICDLQELSYVDAAGMIGCAVGTIRSRLHRGRALLAAKMSVPDAAGRSVERLVEATPAEVSRTADEAQSVDHVRRRQGGKSDERCFA
jgi:RNA polymerase sigma-70 factor (ECF subfamily)